MKGDTSMLNNNRIGFMHFWCQKVLPLVYDNSLSYYEALLKFKHKLNEVIEYTNQIPDYIDEKVTAAFDENHLRELISDVFRTIEDAISANNEGTNVYFHSDYELGDLLWHDNKFYKVIRHIDAGDAVLVNTNIKLVNFADMFNDFIDEVKSRFTENDDGLRETSSMDRPVHDLVWLKGELYEVVKPIAEGNAYIYSGVNKNVDRTNLDKIYDYLLDLISSEIDAREEAIEGVQGDIHDVELLVQAEATAREAADAQLQGYIGNLSNLNTTIKTDTVSAINEVLTRLSNSVGDWVTPEMYGAVGDGTTNDTAAVQAALSSGNNVRFLHDYAVTSVEFTGTETIIDFNGSKLIGIGINDDYVMVIKSAMYNTFYNLNITGNMSTTYYGCLQIRSTTNRQAQYNVFYGMRFSHCWHGLVWGEKVGETSIENAQSETFIFGFNDRTVSVPFLGNQRNGYLTFIGGVFDTNQYETWADARYSFDDGRCIHNIVGQVNTIGCEFACTTNVNNIAFEGQDIHAYESILEICGTQAFINGNFSLINWYNGFIGQAIKTPFIINNHAKGIVRIENGEFHHGGIEVYNSLFYGYDAPETTVYIRNVAWKDTPYGADTFGNLNVYCENFSMPADHITITDHDVTGMSFIDDNSTDVDAFGTCGTGVTASFNDIQAMSMRGIGIQFPATTWSDWFSDYIPVYGGTLYHDNHVMVSTGQAFLFLEFYDGSKNRLSAELIQTSNETVLNRSSLRYLPTGTKYVRLHVTNGENTGEPYVILGDCRLTAALRVTG